MESMKCSKRASRRAIEAGRPDRPPRRRGRRSARGRRDRGSRRDGCRRTRGTRESLRISDEEIARGETISAEESIRRVREREE